MRENYYETLAGAVDAIVARAAEDQCELAKPSEIWDLCRDPLSYGDTRRADFQLLTRKGKKTRSYYHAQIWRLDSGRYEINTYAL